jgi:ribosomal protein S18 acetylase RimI-like enzyme
LKETLLAIFQTSTRFACWLLVDTDNYGAIKLYERTGFRRWSMASPDIASAPGYIMGLSYRRYLKNNAYISAPKDPMACKQM